MTRAILAAIVASTCLVTSLGRPEASPADAGLHANTANRFAGIPSAVQQQAAAGRIAELSRLHAEAADNPGILGELASAYLAAGASADAARTLNEAIDRGLDPDDGDLRLFESARQSPGVAQALRRAAAARRVVSNSRIAFSLPERDLIPEGITWDPLTRAFFIGSILKHKVVMVAPSGEARDFSSPADGLWSVLGLKADGGRRELWACTYAGRDAGAERGSAAVIRCDLRSGRVVKKYVQDNADRAHLFNDLVVAAKGDVYFTDTELGAVYHIAPGSNRVDLFAASLSGANGIALSPDERLLYVATYLQGIVFFDLPRKTWRALPHPPNVNIAGIDGLYSYRGTLVGVQNSAGTPRIVQFVLSKAFDRVESLRIVECRNPLFDIPTTGTIAGEDFYYLANSQLDELDDHGRLKTGVPLKDTVVLRARLISGR